MEHPHSQEERGDALLLEACTGQLVESSEGLVQSIWDERRLERIVHVPGRDLRRSVGYERGGLSIVGFLVEEEVVRLARSPPWVSLWWSPARPGTASASLRCRCVGTPPREPSTIVMVETWWGGLRSIAPAEVEEATLPAVDRHGDSWVGLTGMPSTTLALDDADGLLVDERVDELRHDVAVSPRVVARCARDAG